MAVHALVADIPSMLVLLDDLRVLYSYNYSATKTLRSRKSMATVLMEESDMSDTEGIREGLCIITNSGRHTRCALCSICYTLTVFVVGTGASMDIPSYRFRTYSALFDDRRSNRSSSIGQSSLSGSAKPMDRTTSEPPGANIPVAIAVNRSNSEQVCHQ